MKDPKIKNPIIHTKTGTLLGCKFSEYGAAFVGPLPRAGVGGNDGGIQCRSESDRGASGQSCEATPLTVVPPSEMFAAN